MLWRERLVKKRMMKASSTTAPMLIPTAMPVLDLEGSSSALVSEATADEVGAVVAVLVLVAVAVVVVETEVVELVSLVVLIVMLVVVVVVVVIRLQYGNGISTTSRLFVIAS